MAWDKDVPSTSTPVKTGWPLLLANQAALETAFDQDHDFTTGSTQTGKHNKVSLIEAADIGTGASGLPILGAQTVSGKPELVYANEDDVEIQITSGTKILSASLDSKDEDDMSSDSSSHTSTQQAIKAYGDSGTQTMANKTLTSPVLNTGVSGTAFLDEDDMSSNSASKFASQQSIRAYADAAPAAQMTPATYTTHESVTFPNGLIMKQGVVSRTGSETTITFAVAFPNAILSATATPFRSGAACDSAGLSAISVNAITVRENGSIGTNPQNYYWQAWGS